MWSLGCERGVVYVRFRVYSKVVIEIVIWNVMRDVEFIVIFVIC